MEIIEHTRCHHAGCPESTFLRYESRKEVREGYAYRSKWMCSRHTKPESVLTPENPSISVKIEKVNKKVMSEPGKVLGMFWDGSNGFASGTGFKAWAKDFPEGAILTITCTATVIIPETK